MEHMFGQLRLHGRLQTNARSSNASGVLRVSSPFLYLHGWGDLLEIWDVGEKWYSVRWSFGDMAGWRKVIFSEVIFWRYGMLEKSDIQWGDLLEIWHVGEKWYSVRWSFGYYIWDVGEKGNSVRCSLGDMSCCWKWLFDWFFEDMADIKLRQRSYCC